MKKGLKVLLALGFVLLLILTTLPGCAQPAPAPKPAPTPAPAPAPAPKITPAPAPTAKPSPAPTPTAKPYFEGRTIEFIVTSSAGGGTDTLGRLLAAHFGKFIPGKPAIVVRNVPAAGGLSGSNQVYKAKPDGKTALVGTRVPFNVIRPKGTEFKLEEMHPVYSIAISGVTFVKAGLVSKPEDIVKAKGLIFGYTQPTKLIGGTFVLAKELLGFEVEKMIWGYGSGPSILAFLQGEINLGAQSSTAYNASIKPSVDKGEAMALFQWGRLDARGNIVRSDEVTGVPTAPEVYQRIHGKAPSGPVFDAYKMIVGWAGFHNVIAFPPGMPKNILDILMKAGVDMMKDPLFLSDSAKINPGAAHLAGEELVKIWPSVVTAKGATLDWYRKFLKDKYDANLEEAN